MSKKLEICINKMYNMAWGGKTCKKKKLEQKNTQD